MRSSEKVTVMVQKFSDKNDSCSFVSLFSVEFSGRGPPEVSIFQGDRMDHLNENSFEAF